MRWTAVASAKSDYYEADDADNADACDCCVWSVRSPATRAHIAHARTNFAHIRRVFVVLVASHGRVFECPSTFTPCRSIFIVARICMLNTIRIVNSVNYWGRCTETRGLWGLCSRLSRGWCVFTVPRAHISLWLFLATTVYRNLYMYIGEGHNATAKVSHQNKYIQPAILCVCFGYANGCGSQTRWTDKAHEIRTKHHNLFFSRGPPQTTTQTIAVNNIIISHKLNIKDKQQQTHKKGVCESYATRSILWLRPPRHNGIN